MRSKKPEAIEASEIAILGLPSDHSSSYLRGCAAAPEAIREALSSDASHLCTEAGLDLATEDRLVLAGDLALPEADDFVAVIADHVSELLARNARVLALGGDHAITYPLVRAHVDRFGALDILHFDAHPDLYDVYEGNRLSHACPFARICEAGLMRRLVQVGIRTLNPHQRAQVQRFGVEVIEMRDWSRAREVVPSLAAPLYVSLDLDVLDPAHAPGISHWEPGGASVRDVLEILQALPVSPIGADLVELNPGRDPSGRSAAVAAKLVKELAAAMFEP